MVDYRNVRDNSILDWIKPNNRVVTTSVDDQRGSLRSCTLDFHEHGVSQAVFELVDEVPTRWFRYELEHETHLTILAW
ncbi:hypothetical protein [Fibrobacter sp.]|uniref:hypothetical protein n=1 Tax=Fibrobacter sp. TaxID=35828 RepID=UPI003868877F